MNFHRKISIRNKLISAFPFLPRLTELSWLWKESALWAKSGWRTPPLFPIRRAMLLSEAIKIEAKVFVETGTFLGDTSWHFRNTFKHIHTIEVEPKLADLARDRFSSVPTVTCHEGDSSLLLAAICREIISPCLFFLDGHYSGGVTGLSEKECPVIEELDAIFAHMKVPFTVVIDDARLFGTHESYPDLNQIQEWLLRNGSTHRLRVENDALIVSPSEGLVISD